MQGLSWMRCCWPRVDWVNPSVMMYRCIGRGTWSVCDLSPVRWSIRAESDRLRHGSWLIVKPKQESWSKGSVADGGDWEGWRVTESLEGRNGWALLDERGAGGEEVAWNAKVNENLRLELELEMAWVVIARGKNVKHDLGECVCNWHIWPVLAWVLSHIVRVNDVLCDAQSSGDYVFRYHVGVRENNLSGNLNGA